MSFYKNILAFSAAAAALLFASCSAVDDNVNEPEIPGDSDDGMVDVTLYVTANTSLSRAGYLPRPDWAVDDNDDFNGEAGGWQKSIGRGNNVNKLILEVYLQDEDQFGQTAITRLTQYGDEGSGQKVYYDFGPNQIKEISLRLMRNKTYRLAFWAQSLSCDAYITDLNDTVNLNNPNCRITGKDVGLRNVRVNYEGAKNNDDNRDAFCKVETFSVTATNIERTIVLQRPFAQINVGTTGADIEYLANGDNVYPNVEIGNTAVTFGRIEGDKKLGCVATRMDVVLDKIDDADSTLTTATFEMSPIPEEYLYVDLDGDYLFHGYEKKFPTYTKDDGFLTETFKYLCMSYVLIPSSVIKTEPANPDDPEDSETNVSYDEDGNLVYEKQFLLNMNVTFGDKSGKKYGSLLVDDVKARRNWRTNILGGLGESEVSIVQSSTIEAGYQTDYENYNYISQ